jgi:hypothetical protein
MTFGQIKLLVRAPGHCRDNPPKSVSLRSNKIKYTNNESNQENHT